MIQNEEMGRMAIDFWSLLEKTSEVMEWKIGRPSSSSIYVKSESLNHYRIFTGSFVYLKQERTAPIVIGSKFKVREEGEDIRP